MESKDALQSTTNYAIAALVVTFLASHGVVLDLETAAALVSAAVGFFGRWKAGGIKSVAGVAIPQPESK